MSNIVELPINKKPILRTYHYLAFPISIITAYKEYEEAYNDKNTKLIDFINIINKLHIQERDILAKIYGLRVIKYAK